eukprot:CAMPEP_0197700422 /NCGR_PEP_ID=MMETSP1338-20131121/121955_1 /TAXON_ID=43686 ORGANISM="Pelagodinium beii, Strain RCC1491" /NCGR_SAMPLE_ID=MMETSP1338 /ASSEMBLY_ACC=CAM_ASM_000754 /LENGTH=326 /DNA_ID=CAMNT_0043284033 /DNA_START=79 /DNA_END=1055 /DNA_ORIENTATION=+
MSVSAEASTDAMQRLEGLKSAAGAGAEFSAMELDSAEASLRKAGGTDGVKWAALREQLAQTAHQNYKDWPKTEEDADEFSKLLSCDMPVFRQIFQRVFRDGGWEAAAESAAKRETTPWIVLVTGLNGIRKTTCMYQPWFPDLLSSALKSPNGELVPKDELPHGRNGFFRQLDHIIATIASEEFRTLYEVEDVNRYSSLKDGIFSRYRKIAETWGIALVKEAKRHRLNIMAETSGRDAGMFRYIDHCFPDDSYRKLVLHFDINDISFAEKSVDSRMLREMADGRLALAGSTQDIIKVNAGGPYGSQVLQSVQADSNKVWDEVLSGRL